MSSGLDRRSFLTRAGVAGAGLALGGGGLAACSKDGEADIAAAHSVSDTIAEQTEPFRGAHQSGIVTAAQDRMVFATYDVLDTSRDALAEMLVTWTAQAEAMTRGDLVPGGFSGELVPTADTGEAYGLPPAHLTVTIGYGPELFDDRFGLAERRPEALEQLPRFPGDEIRPEISDGAICLQACANDPLVAYHAIHELTRSGVGVVSTRMFQVGFGRTSSTSKSQATARNLMGFKDGTRNLKSEEAALVDKWVWSQGSGKSDWMDGGSYLAARKIKMFVENWDRETRKDQENTFGRFKDTGAPYGADSEFATPDLKARAADGSPVIPIDAHIRRASPEDNGGVHLLRRGYNYADGVDPVTGDLDSGLFFIAFTSEPAHFERVQRHVAQMDGLNEYIRHISSALFACPKGLGPKETWADQLFA